MDPDPIQAAAERKRTLGDIMSASAFPALIASIEAKHYQELVRAGVPPEHALALTQTTVEKLLDTGSDLLRSARGVAEALAPVLQDAMKLADHPLVKQALDVR